MKKIIISLLTLILVLVCAVSCANDNKNQGGEQNKPSEPTVVKPADLGTATVYAPGDKVYIITTENNGAITNLKDELNAMLSVKSGGGANTVGIFTQTNGLEILINIYDTERKPVVATALKPLDRIETESAFEMRYVIYAKSGQLVINCETNTYTNLQAIDYVVNGFVDKYIKGQKYFACAEGVLESGVIDLVPLQEEIDVEYIKDKWDALEYAFKEKYGEIVGGELTDAFRTYYSMISDNLVGWWANMYDPGIGGFYYTASGRDHLGYLPGIEATGQIIGHLTSSGMLSTLGGSVAQNLPKLMQYQIAYYYKSLQDPDGLFYNPQLGKAGSSSYRIGRDQGHAIDKMISFGAWPTYDCDRSGTFYKGDGKTADQWWDEMVADGKISPDVARPYVPKSLADYENYITGNLTETSAENAIAKLMSTSAVVQTADESQTKQPKYFKSHADFDTWLSGYDPDKNPYSACSNVNAAYNSLIGPDSDALGPAEAPGKWYDGMTLKEMTIDWFNRHINGRGLFGAYDENSTDPSAGCKYANTNGLMKAIPVYNSWGIAYPEPLKAVQGCLIGIMSDEESKTNICETYNIWEALAGVLTNVKNYGTEEQQAELFGYTDPTGKWVQGTIYEALGKDGPAAVINTPCLLSMFIILVIGIPPATHSLAG